MGTSASVSARHQELDRLKFLMIKHKVTDKSNRKDWYQLCNKLEKYSGEENYELL